MCYLPKHSIELTEEVDHVQVGHSFICGTDFEIICSVITSQGQVK
jgi:hypothetical protein